MAESPGGVTAVGATASLAPGEAPPELVTRLRERGMRVTPQRSMVLAAVRELGHATPEQLSERVPGVDVTTVYRNLELLEELGFVRHAHLGHGAPSYRPAEDQHIHVVCHACGEVVDAPPALVDRLEQQLLDERGFVLDRAHFTVFGRCGSCVAAGDVVEHDHPHPREHRHPAPTLNPT